MKKSSDYSQHADECRALARRMDNVEKRGMLLKMADTWENLAEARARSVEGSSVLPSLTGQHPERRRAPELAVCRLNNSRMARQPGWIGGNS
jgi:hypothetical protein